MEDETGRLWWDAKSFYQPPQDHPFAIILLNKSLNKDNSSFFTSVWQRASVRVCVDGATNQYHKLRGNSKVHSGMSPGNGGNTLECGVAHLSLGSDCLELPHIISGDFDSIHPDVLTHYDRLGVHIIPTLDQDESDFTKAARELGKYITKRNIQIKHVVVIAAVNSERFDHVLGNISTLYKVGNLVPVPVVIISGGSLFWLLNGGDHTIKVSEEVILNPRRSWCGLIPIGHPATVTTTGLKWNLDNQVLGFGHLVSTSNTYDPTQEGQVTITTGQPLLWTMGWDIDKLYQADNCAASLELNSCNQGDPSSNPLPVTKSNVDPFIGNEGDCP